MEFIVVIIVTHSSSETHSFVKTNGLYLLFNIRSNLYLVGNRGNER